MKISKIITDYINIDDRKHEPRQIGRYWATDISAVMKGYLTVENFFDRKPADLTGCQMMLTGMAMENMLKKLFDKSKINCESQAKKEMKINDEITLVVKPDFVFKDFIIETKFPFGMVRDKEIPERYVHQLECETQAFNLPVYLGVLSVPFNLRLIPYCSSWRRWKNIQKVLIKFHEELKRYASTEKS